MIAGLTNSTEVDMSRYTTVMLGGLAMASMMGVLMIWWLAFNEGSGFVGMLFIVGMLVGIAVFSGGAAEALRAPADDATTCSTHRSASDESQIRHAVQ